jgi:hypothetical protein
VRTPRLFGIEDVGIADVAYYRFRAPHSALGYDAGDMSDWRIESPMICTSPYAPTA